MGRTTARVAVFGIVAAIFVLILAAIGFDWPVVRWLGPAGYAVLALAILIGLVRRRLRRTTPKASIASSDDFSDIQLGRRPATEYPRDEASSSQIGDPPDSYPLPPHRP